MWMLTVWWDENGKTCLRQIILGNQHQFARFLHQRFFGYIRSFHKDNQQVAAHRSNDVQHTPSSCLCAG